jgi:hypothetical protein
MMSMYSERGSTKTATSQHIDHTVANIDHKVDSYVHPTFWGKVQAYTGFGFDIAKDIIEARYYLNPTAIQLTNPSSAAHASRTGTAQ